MLERERGEGVISNSSPSFFSWSGSTQSFDFSVKYIGKYSGLHIFFDAHVSNVKMTLLKISLTVLPQTKIKTLICSISAIYTRTNVSTYNLSVLEKTIS